MPQHPEAVFPDLQAVMLRYTNGDLPEDQRAFPYYDNKVVRWVHQDELRRLAALQGAYPQANTQRGQK